MAGLEMAEFIQNEIDKEHLPLAIFIDFSKAFDTIDHEILIAKLEYYGVRDREPCWFTSYLSNRKHFTCINDVFSSELDIISGVPQGSILGPSLFLIYVNDIHKSCNIFQNLNFADDTNLFSSICLSKKHKSCMNTGTKINTLNEELSNFVTWTRANKLLVNFDKTKFMIFHHAQRKISQDMTPKLYLNDHEIELVKNHKFLGILFDTNMTWSDHLWFLSNKINSICGMLNNMKYLLPKHTIKTIYHSLIGSHLSYGLLLWGKKSVQLMNLQKKAVRIISRSHYLAHTEPIFKQENILKITDSYKMDCLKIFYKYKTNNLPSAVKNLFRESPERFHSYPTSGQQRLQGMHLIEKIAISEKTRQLLSYNLPLIVNSVPGDIIDPIPSISYCSFKDKVKKYFLGFYSSVACSTPNYYSCNVISSSS